MDNYYEPFESEEEKTQKAGLKDQDSKSDPEVEYKEAYNYCIYLLSKRDYSKYKITKKLNSRKYSIETKEKVIQKIIDQGYLREEAYTTMRIKTLLYKGYANFFIKQKLAEEKLEVDDHRIDQLREENHISNHESIHYLLDKKLRYKEIPEDKEQYYKLRDKVIRFLISKGHNYQEARESFKEYLENKKP